MLRLEGGSQAKSRGKGVQGRESHRYKGPVIGKSLLGIEAAVTEA